MIKKGNLSASLLNWLMSTLQLGPGIGDVFYLVPSASAYHSWLANEQRVSGEHIFTTFASAYAALTGDRNDVLCAFPGLYTGTASLDWTKDHTHLIGLGGPNILGRSGRPNCMIHTDTAGVDYTIHHTGDFCQFHNIGVSNGNTGGSATAANLSAMKLDGYGNYFKRTSFRGMMSAAQAGEEHCSSLEIGQSGECEFDECQIGWNSFGITRTITTQGQLLFSWDGVPPSASNMVFRNTVLHSRAETVGVPMVYFGNAVGTDRFLLFDNCHFENFWINWAGICDSVFEHAQTAQQTTNLDLRNCTARGYGYWIPAGRNFGAAGGSWIEANMPITGVGGGLLRAPTGLSGT